MNLLARQKYRFLAMNRRWHPHGLGFHRDARPFDRTAIGISLSSGSRGDVGRKETEPPSRSDFRGIRVSGEFWPGSSRGERGQRAGGRRVERASGALAGAKCVEVGGLEGDRTDKPLCQKGSALGRTVKCQGHGPRLDAGGQGAGPEVQSCRRGRPSQILVVEQPDKPVTTDAETRDGRGGHRDCRHLLAEFASAVQDAHGYEVGSRVGIDVPKGEGPERADPQGLETGAIAVVDGRDERASLSRSTEARSRASFSRPPSRRTGTAPRGRNSCRTSWASRTRWDSRRRCRSKIWARRGIAFGRHELKSRRRSLDHGTIRPWVYRAERTILRALREIPEQIDGIAQGFSGHQWPSRPVFVVFLMFVHISVTIIAGSEPSFAALAVSTVDPSAHERARFLHKESNSE
jgi:hypothetical protein